MLSVDGFFSLNPQASDMYLMPWRYRAVLHASECLRKLSHTVPLLAKCADSLYISSRKDS